MPLSKAIWTRIGTIANGALVATASRGPERSFSRVWRAVNSRSRDCLCYPCSIIFVSGERSEEHTSELQSLMRISYAVFCLKKKNRDSSNTDTLNSSHKYAQ